MLLLMSRWLMLLLLLLPPPPRLLFLLLGRTSWLVSGVSEWVGGSLLSSGWVVWPWGRTVEIAGASPSTPVAVASRSRRVTGQSA